MRRCVFVSATPADYEHEHSSQVVEQVVRPTGLIDPRLEVRPARTQVDDVLGEISLRVQREERVLITTLTKRMAEDLTDFLAEHDVKVRYLHSDSTTSSASRSSATCALGVFDVLVGINLLREGLDLPEVSLVAILDADKEGFLRSERSLIQTIGRAARHLNGTAILYADTVTQSMRKAIDETNRRRARQMIFNRENGIVPRGVRKEVRELIDGVYRQRRRTRRIEGGGSGRRLRGDEREAGGQGDQAPREGDVRLRQESGIREGGQDAGPAGRPSREGVRCGQGRQRDPAGADGAGGVISIAQARIDGSRTGVQIARGRELGGRGAVSGTWVRDVSTGALGSTGTLHRVDHSGLLSFVCLLHLITTHYSLPPQTPPNAKPATERRVI